MSWFDDVAKHILNHLEDYAHEFLNPHSLNRAGKSIFVNSCPFCNHNDCFSLTKGVNAAKCFSCDETGTLIQIVQKLYGEVEGLQKLADWSGNPYNFAGHTPEKAAEKERHARYQRICQRAVDHYHNRLMTVRIFKADGDIIPAEHQVKVRKHGRTILEKYRVGYSGGFQELQTALLEEGYTQEEINETKKLIFIPDGYFVYPYFDTKGNLVRINCKLFVRYCRGKQKAGGGGYHYDCDFHTEVLDDYMQKSHENQKNHVMNSNNFSRGDKEGVFLFHPKDINNKKKKYLILVEGENDIVSTEEALLKLPTSYQKAFAVAGIGGNAPQGIFTAEFLRQFDEIYEAFDNDEAGDKYREQLDREMPDVPLKHLDIPVLYNDIDEFLKTQEGADELFKNMLDLAKSVTTQNYRIWREEPKHHWVLKNRHYAIRYEIDHYDHRSSKKGFSGTLMRFNGNQQVEKKLGDIDAIKLPGEEMNRLKIALSTKLTTFYHEIRMVKDEPKRSFDELLDIFHFTKSKYEATKQIAWYIFHAPEKEYEAKTRAIQSKIRNETDVANILREVNGYENQEIDPFGHFPKIQLAQSFFPGNNDGYMYFVKTFKDGETAKRVPCLISNKQEEIRLDLLKKKDSQSLLLINNKYELPIEIETNQVEVEDLSLQHVWVHRWKKNEIKDIDISPSTIIREIEAFIRQTYYTSDDVVKVLALWIYATYFYTLFKNGFPYMVFNGAKGTGKSTLDDIVYLLAFNPTFSVSISGPALYRTVSVFGGTFILDEQENMSNSSKVNESDLAAVIKAGYSDKGKVHRWDNDTKFAEGFSAFGPKVISNIMGVEDVIADRCIEIKTYSAKEEHLSKLTDTSIFKDLRREEVHSITSRAAISALTHFKEVDRVFHDNTRVDTGNARLTQILRPLVTIARVVGGDYEEHLMAFYKNEVQSSKADVALSTLEGKIKYTLLSIAEEHLGLTKKPWVLKLTHAYDKDIIVDKDGFFEVDTVQFKVLAEELANDPTDNYLRGQINAAVKNVMGKHFDFKQRRYNTRITVSDELLIKKLNGRQVQGYRYTFNVREFITEQVQRLRLAEEEKAEELF